MKSVILGVQPQTDHPVLVNAGIVDMAKAGIGDAVVVLVIQNTTHAFDVSPKGAGRLAVTGTIESLSHVRLA